MLKVDVKNCRNIDSAVAYLTNNRIKGVLKSNMSLKFYKYTLVHLQTISLPYGADKRKLFFIDTNFFPFQIYFHFEFEIILILLLF